MCQIRIILILFISLNPCQIRREIYFISIRNPILQRLPCHQQNYDFAQILSASDCCHLKGCLESNLFYPDLIWAQYAQDFLDDEKRICYQIVSSHQDFRGPLTGVRLLCTLHFLQVCHEDWAFELLILFHHFCSNQAGSQMLN